MSGKGCADGLEVNIKVRKGRTRTWREKEHEVNEGRGSKLRENKKKSYSVKDVLQVNERGEQGEKDKKKLRRW